MGGIQLLKYIKTYMLFRMLSTPYINIHQMAEIAEKAISVFGRFYQVQQIERVFFSRNCLMLSSIRSQPFSACWRLTRIVNAIKKDKETYYLSFFNSLWKISLWLAISCSRMCSSEPKLMLIFLLEEILFLYETCWDIFFILLGKLIQSRIL